tara:strand:- start:520 stop:1794 length:1275 start_codon:yes stop_codon:yes gene_type:complete
MKKSETLVSFDLLRENIVFILLSTAVTVVLYYIKYFEGPYSLHYSILFGIVLLLTLVIGYKYKNPLQYSPRHVLFVKDRDDPIVKMEPTIDPIISRLGLVKSDEFVNVRYSMYPELDLGIDLDPNTGVITGFPMELGNFTSEVKMKFLGGQYSTTVRLEVVETVRSRAIQKRDEFAPPRTVAQLLMREEDVIQREKDVDSDINRKRERLEEEYISKELSLREQIDFERETFNTKLEGIEKEYKLKLKDRDSTIEDLKAEMASKLKELEDSKDLKIDKLEAEMSEALQNKEKEFVEFEKDIKSKYEEKEKSLLVEEATEEEPESKPEEEVVEEEPEEVTEEKVVEEEPEEEPEEEVVEEESEEVVDEEMEEEPEEEAVEEEPEEEDEEYDYVSMTKAELAELAKKRGLAFSGTKKKLISRLEDND